MKVFPLDLRWTKPVQDSHLPTAPDPIGNKNEAGNTQMYQWMAVLSVITIMAVIIGLNWNSAKSKATAMTESMGNVNKAVDIAVLDIGCYPTIPSVLFDSTQATAANSFCGVAASTTWNGPYLKAQPVDANGNIVMRNVSATSVMSIGRVATTVNNMNWIYYTQVNNVPNDVLAQAMKLCSGSATNANAGNIAAQLQTQPCGYTAGTTNGTFYSYIAMTQ
jgi:type II secretory pathway pseudopilin PulG